MNDAIDDFHELKEVLEENDFGISNVNFSHDVEADGMRGFRVEMEIIRTE